MIMGLLMAVAVSAAPSPACVKLQKDFATWEKVWAMTHDLNAKMLSSERMFVEQTGTGRAALARSEEKMKEEDRDYAARLDRITNLMIANKCPPDRVASWFTYSEKNPNKPQP